MHVCPHSCCTRHKAEFMTNHLTLGAQDELKNIADTSASCDSASCMRSPLTWCRTASRRTSPLRQRVATKRAELKNIAKIHPAAAGLLRKLAPDIARKAEISGTTCHLSSNGHSHTLTYTHMQSHTLRYTRIRSHTVIYTQIHSHTHSSV